MNLRSAAESIGVATVVAGVALVVVPGVGVGGVDSTVVLLVGAAAAVQAFVEIRRRRNAEFERTEPDDPEQRYEPDSPGTSTTDLIEGVRSGGPRASAGRGRLRTRIREAAVETMARTDGCSREEAERRIETGAWTDDYRAASFLGDPGRTPKLRELLTGVLAGGNRFAGRAIRTIDVVYDRSERSGASGDGGDAGAGSSRKPGRSSALLGAIGRIVDRATDGGDEASDRTDGRAASGSGASTGDDPENGSTTEPIENA